MPTHAIQSLADTLVPTLAQGGGGGGGGPNIPIQGLFVLLLLAFSFLSWVWKKLAEQKAIKDAQDRARAAQEYKLRTGRDADEVAIGPTATAPGAPARSGSVDEERLRELVQRRLRESAGGGQTAGSGSSGAGSPVPPSMPAPSPRPASAGGPSGSAGGGGAAGGGKPVTAELWPGGPVVVIQPGGAPAGGPGGGGGGGGGQPQRTVVVRPAPAAGNRERAQPQPAPTRKNKTKAPATRESASDASLAASLRARDGSVSTERQATQRMVAQAEREARAEESRRAAARVPTLRETLPKTPAQWRAAFVAAEVLGRPVSLREPELR